MPEIAMANYTDTRAAFAFKLLLVMANYSAMAVADIDDFSGPWNKLSATDWAAVQEMEAITLALGEYAVDEAQKSEAFKLSLKPYYCLALLSIAKKTKFKVASLARQQKRYKDQ